ncbi:MAG TPA: DUF6596 domain-containing protein [Bryobacteraceae bacterium]|nr:DUF6596 domain-containing protein [Bryobacteraceae bacterium]
MIPPASPTLEHLLRDLAPRVLASLLRRFRDFAAAEDAVQEALLAAASQWPAQGIPENPKAWLIQVAARRMADEVRAAAARRRRESETAAHLGVLSPGSLDTEQDDTLILFFMCCHPALTPSSAIALTLRAVGGLNTAEIARAFLVPESTMAQRISRAKQTIKTSKIPFALPEPAERTQRLRSVLHVLYLIFNEGYTASSGDDLHRPDLAAEAIRLVRAVRQLVPAEPEILGLLALMLLTDARRHARTGPGGELIPLDQQNRQLWEQSQIAEGLALVAEALPSGAVGPYQLQAAIAALHDEAPTAAETDWPQILALYEVLKRISPNPVIVLNHAVAAAMVHGPETGIALLDALEQSGQLPHTHRIAAARAHLYERAGNLSSAIENYRLAAARTASVPEYTYLVAQAARLTEGES